MLQVCPQGLLVLEVPPTMWTALHLHPSYKVENPTPKAVELSKAVPGECLPRCLILNSRKSLLSKERNVPPKYNSEHAFEDSPERSAECSGDIRKSYACPYF